MDIIQQLSTFWIETISDMEPAMKKYIVRIGVGLIVMQFLAVRFVRHPEQEEFIRIRQALVVTLGLVIILFSPMNWTVEMPDYLQVILITLCLWTDMIFPFFLASNLIRTYGRQILARRIFYLTIILGALIQVAVLGGR